MAADGALITLRRFELQAIAAIYNEQNALFKYPTDTHTHTSSRRLTRTHIYSVCVYMESDKHINCIIYELHFFTQFRRSTYLMHRQRYFVYSYWFHV